MGPDSQYIMNPDSLTNKEKTWDHSTITDTYSPFIEQMHTLELAVHPYTLQDDMLKFTDSMFEEA